MTRIEQAIAALYDYSTREGATPKKVKANMKKAGFTAAEISEAIEKMTGKP